MGIEHYNQPVSVFFILEVCNAFFTTVFGLGRIYFEALREYKKKKHKHKQYVT